MTVLTLLYQSLLASIGLTIVWAAYSIFNSLDSVRRRRAAQVQYGCGPLFQPTPWDFSGFYGLYKAMTAAGEHRLLQYWEDNYKKWGPTHGSIRRGKVLITTKEPENFKAVLATKFDDWYVPSMQWPNMMLIRRQGRFTTANWLPTIAWQRYLHYGWWLLDAFSGRTTTSIREDPSCCR